MSTELFWENLKLIKERFPQLAQAVEKHNIDNLAFDIVEKQSVSISINGIQLSSAYDPVEEAFEYRTLTSGNEYHVWGFGIGNVPELLLQDKSAKKITIYIYNLDVFKLVLALMPKAWLSDKRVELVYVYKDMPELSNILKSLFHNGAIVLNPDKSLLEQSDDQWLLHRFENKIVSTHVHRNQLKRDDEFLEREKENYPILKKLPSLDQVIQNTKIKEAFCIGAGPSLQAHIEEIKDLYNKVERPFFIAPSTALKCLLDNDIIPDAVVVVDLDSSPKYISFDDLKNSTLLFASRVNKNIIEPWQGRKYYFHLHDETYDRFNQRLPMKFRSYICGSVIHTIAHIAIELGAKKINLIGCDFGFPNKIWHSGRDGMGKITADTVIENGHGEQIESNRVYRMFCSGMENIISMVNGVEFINWSRMGAKIIGAKYRDEVEAK